MRLRSIPAAVPLAGLALLAIWLSSRRAQATATDGAALPPTMKRRMSRLPDGAASFGYTTDGDVLFFDAEGRQV